MQDWVSSLHARPERITRYLVLFVSSAKPHVCKSIFVCAVAFPVSTQSLAIRPGKRMWVQVALELWDALRERQAQLMLEGNKAGISNHSTWAMASAVSIHVQPLALVEILLWRGGLWYSKFNCLRKDPRGRNRVWLDRVNFIMRIELKKKS